MPPELPETARPMVASYLTLRRAVGVSGLLLPVALGPVGWLLFGVPIQDDLSSYYHTPLRDLFVGALCAVGTFLFCYRGVDPAENWTANVGCAAALAAAFFPIDADSAPPYQRTTTGLLHTLAGGLFFLTLACYSLVHFPRSRSGGPEDEPPGPRVRQRNFVYRTSGIVILLGTVAMGAYLFLLPHEFREACDRWNVLFWLEGTAAWAFAAAWLTKGRVIGSEIALDLLAFARSRLPPPLRPRADDRGE